MRRQTLAGAGLESLQAIALQYQILEQHGADVTVEELLGERTTRSTALADRRWWRSRCVSHACQVLREIEARGLTHHRNRDRPAPAGSQGAHRRRAGPDDQGVQAGTDRLPGCAARARFGLTQLQRSYLIGRGDAVRDRQRRQPRVPARSRACWDLDRLEAALGEVVAQARHAAHPLPARRPPGPGAHGADADRAARPAGPVRCASSEQIRTGTRASARTGSCPPTGRRWCWPRSRSSPTTGWCCTSATTAWSWTASARSSSSATGGAAYHGQTPPTRRAKKRSRSQALRGARWRRPRDKAPAQRSRAYWLGPARRPRARTRDLPLQHQPRRRSTGPGSPSKRHPRRGVVGCPERTRRPAAGLTPSGCC